ncbi:hypothetical protein [Sphingomonas hengshuiensis]|uniref:hypothetical protein n=1 Tax=Sphingomonas hengshuiensis TaxID=1609977 RepID=UPI0012B94A2F|nr:hypothetical protein [Sphingomonas hengshuiensis]
MGKREEGQGMAYTEDGRYEISTVLSRTFDTIGANFLLFAGLSLVLSGLPAFAIDWWQASQIAVDTTDSMAVLRPAVFVPIVIVWLVSIVSSTVLQAALTRATVQHLSGETPNFARCLKVGLALFLPMIAISFLLAIGVGVGFLLLVVPGIILWLMWSVTVPVYVQEQVGIFEAFGRSRELTSGSRWRIFLTMLVLVFALWLLAIPVGMLTAAARSAGSATMLLSVLGAIVSALSSMVMVSIQACIYVELRDVKEGVAPGDLEAIFA